MTSSRTTHSPVAPQRRMNANNRPTRREVLVAGTTAALTLLAWPGRAQVSSDGITPFSYHAPDVALADLARRLDQLRWPERETGAAWEQGPPLAALQALLAYSRTRHEL